MHDLSHRRRISVRPSIGRDLLCGIVFSLLLSSTACTGDPQPPPVEGAISGDLQLTGSSTLAPLASEIGKRFETLHPQVRVDVQTGGSSRGIADATSGLADIGMSSRSLKESERQGRKTWTLAMDGVAFIVHAENPVAELSRPQLRAILSGQVADWSELGGRPGEIIFINRAQGRSELELVSGYLDLPVAAMQADLIAGENQQGLKMVANEPRAITYMSVGASQYEASRGVPIRPLPLEGIEATVATVAAGEFPLSRPLLMITSPQPDALTQAFIDYARSSQVHDLVRQLSYVPVTL